MSFRSWLFDNSVVERLVDEVVEMRTQVNRLRIEVAQITDKTKQQSAWGGSGGQSNTKDSAVSEFTSFKLTGGRSFEVVRVRDGVFLKCDGFETEDSAAQAAARLCAEFPLEEFAVYGVIRRFKAKIPVEDVRIYDAPAHPTHSSPSEMEQRA